MANKSAILPKPKKDARGYTKTQLMAHLSEAVNKRGDAGELTKKQVNAVVEELARARLLRGGGAAQRGEQQGGHGERCKAFGQGHGVYPL